VDDDLVPVLEGELGDPRAHRPGADDPDNLARHAASVRAGG
jgi:hypothetical protein